MYKTCIKLKIYHKLNSQLEIQKQRSNLTTTPPHKALDRSSAGK
ncbi:hypothetical protein [Candidatus Sarmatiella mevalonica]|nr:hypothetical protein [Candidatus Sarmatiella mevalonica]